METEQKEKKTIKGLLVYYFSKIVDGKSIGIGNQLETDKETGKIK